MNFRSRRLIRKFYKDRNYEPLLKLAENYQSFEDRPWNMWEMYRHLDARFPDSLFILTVRDAKSWWGSTDRWISVSKPYAADRYKQHLQVADANPEAMIASYLRYNEEVSEYFKGTGKLLKFDVAAGDGWETLCKFLDKPVPRSDFPHINRQSYSPDDYQMIALERLMEHGVACQACGHITPSVEFPPRRRRSKSLLVRRIRRRISTSRALGKDIIRASVQRVAWFLHCADRLLNQKNLPGSKTQNHPPRALLDSLELAVVSCFFNPNGSQRRVANFKAFLAGIRASGVHVLSIEVATGSAPFQLDEADDVIRLRSDDIMWHKERLLNIGIRRLLAQGYRKIAWLDADIIFKDSNWPALLAAKLDSVNLCQVFGTVAIAGQEKGVPVIGTSAVKYFLEKKHLYSQSPLNLSGLFRGQLRGGQSGFGWAARAEVLTQVPLFDKGIIGGGDKLILAASLAPDRWDPRFQTLTDSSVACEKCGHQNHSAAYTECFLDWANRWAAAVDNKVGFADLHISDMYHGNHRERKYHSRREILYKHQFDPARDLTTDQAGVLAWNSDKDELHRDLQAYFISRREDV